MRGFLPTAKGRAAVSLGSAVVGASVAFSLWGRPQFREPPAPIRRLAIDWNVSEKGSAATRDRVVLKLKSSGKVEVVARLAEADAVLHGQATVWATGYVSPNPRVKSLQEAHYHGYASAELNSTRGETLWSYLVTPRSSWKSITDDLGDQLAEEVLKALASKEVGERPAANPAEGGGARGPTPRVILSGAGGTLPAPIYRKWFESFERARTDVEVRYGEVGSAEGVRQFLAGTVDFGATDFPIPDKELAKANRRALQVATVLGAVVPIYNLKSAPEGLDLTPEILAGIFLGRIRRWNAPEIKAINKHLGLPDEPILVIHRSDGSGTTYAWTEYLSKISAEWKSAAGTGPTVDWPVGRGAVGNQGVAEAVHDTPDSIGYVEYIYALQHELSFAAVRDLAGDYVKADLDSLKAAAKTAATPDGNPFHWSISNPPGKRVYPIATFTWVLVLAEGPDTQKQKALKELLEWMLTEGQKQCGALGYAPLPTELATRELRAVAAMK